MFGQEFDSPHLHYNSKSILFKARKTLILRAFCFSGPFIMFRGKLIITAGDRPNKSFGINNRWISNINKLNRV
jgi:hypothetical protein